MIKVETGKKKMGRPTTDPKNHVVKLRMSDNELSILEKCCELTGHNKTDVLKMGVKKVYQELLDNE